VQLNTGPVLSLLRIGEAVELNEEHVLIKEWRAEGPLGILLAVINYINTPQQNELFESFQQLAHKELPPNATDGDRKALQPVKPVVTRWNSFYSCFERAAKLQSAVNAYANYHILDTKQRIDRAIRQNNELTEWMKSDRLTAADWQVITEYIDVLRPLKTATKRLEGHGEHGKIGSVAEIFPVFEVLFHKLKQQLQNFNSVDHEEHEEAPEDHLAINLRRTILKAREYYSKLDDSPAYYAATVLHPRYKAFCDSVSAENLKWFLANNRSFDALWAEYRTLPKARVRPQTLSNDLDDAIDSLCNSKRATTNNDEDEYRLNNQAPSSKQAATTLLANQASSSQAALLI